MVKNLDVFWKALVLTAIVFILGVLLGYFLEKNRIDNFREEFSNIEAQWADARLLSRYFSEISPELCDEAIKQNLIFADKIYREGLKLDNYDSAAPLTEKEIEFERKRYALFKSEFLLNSISLKERCNANYVNLIYFFTANPTADEGAKQAVQSKILEEIKNEYGSELMLIPLPIDLDIFVINILKNTHNIKEAPTILINENIKLEGVQSRDALKSELEKARKSSPL